MKRTFIYAVLALAATATLFSISTPISSGRTQAATQNAQPAAAPPIFMVRETIVKPEMTDEYLAFTKNETIPMYKKAGVKQMAVYTTANFGEVKYVFIRPVDNLKEFDEPNTYIKALGEEGGRAWTAKWRRLIVSSSGFLTQLRPELSILPKPGQAPKLGLLVRHTVAVGRTADFEAIYKSDYLPVTTKAGLKVSLVGKVSLGGDSNEYLTMNWFDSFDEIQKWATAAQMQGFGKIAPKEVGITLHRETAVYRYLPELSIAPAPPKAESKE